MKSTELEVSEYRKNSAFAISAKALSLSKKSPKEVAFLLKIWYNRSRKIQVVKRC